MGTRSKHRARPLSALEQDRAWAGLIYGNRHERRKARALLLHHARAHDKHGRPYSDTHGNPIAIPAMVVALSLMVALAAGLLAQ